MTSTEVARQLRKLSKKHSADVYIYAATVNSENVDRLRRVICAQKTRQPNAIIFLATLGGEPEAAFRLSACLGRKYTTVFAYIFGLCKSAGTLAVIGAHKIVWGDFGELGPLDVQLAKPDEIYPTSSGLDIFQALGVIRNSTFETFEDYLSRIVTDSEGHISAKTSAEIASTLAVGLFSPMTSQIDPERLGEVQRAITIANAYASRLNKGNLKREALEKLVQGYPTHGFVIDLEEAKKLFNNIRHADALDSSIAAALPALRRQGSMVGDLLQLYPLPKGKQSNVAKTKTKAKRTTRIRAVHARRDARAATNIAPIGGDAASNLASAKSDDYSRESGVRRSSQKRQAVGE